MNQGLATTEDRRIILMKSGLAHFVSRETADRIEERLQAQQAHSFLKILELGITINTAQVEGVYDMAQYEETSKLKRGEWQCAYRKWHTRKEECFCKRDWYRQQEQQKRERDQADMYRPRTPEEIEHARKKSDELRRDLENSGVLPTKK